MRLIYAAFLCSFFLVTHFANAQHIGEKVIVINDATLKSGKETVGRVPSGAILPVKEVNTEWLWVQYEDKLGWINQSDIIAFSSGYDYFTDKISTNPGLGYYIYRSNILIELERWQEAIEDCNSALGYDANNSIALSNRAYCHITLKNFDAAIADSNSVISKNPAETLAYNLLGLAYINKSDALQAAKNFDRAIELNPKFVNAYLNRSITSSMQFMYDKALGDLNKLLSIQPDHENGLNYRGVAYFQLSRFDDAIADFSKVIAINPQNSGALVNRSSAYNEIGEFTKALADIEAALKINPKIPAAYNNRGFALHQLKKYPEAISDYQKAAEMNPDLITPWRNLADLYLNAQDPAFKDLAKALEFARKSCELSVDKDWKSLRNLAFVYAARNDFPQAATTMKKAISQTPENQKSILEKLLVEYEKQATTK